VEKNIPLTISLLVLFVMLNFIESSLYLSGIYIFIDTGAWVPNDIVRLFCGLVLEAIAIEQISVRVWEAGDDRPAQGLHIALDSLELATHVMREHPVKLLHSLVVGGPHAEAAAAAAGDSCLLPSSSSKSSSFSSPSVSSSSPLSSSSLWSTCFPTLPDDSDIAALLIAEEERRKREVASSATAIAQSVLQSAAAVFRTTGVSPPARIFDNATADADADADALPLSPTVSSASIWSTSDELARCDSFPPPSSPVVSDGIGSGKLSSSSLLSAALSSLSSSPTTSARVSSAPLLSSAPSISSSSSSSSSSPPWHRKLSTLPPSPAVIIDLCGVGLYSITGTRLSLRRVTAHIIGNAQWAALTAQDASRNSLQNEIASGRCVVVQVDWSERGVKTTRQFSKGTPRFEIFRPFPIQPPAGRTRFGTPLQVNWSRN
jgi:hypothetical protein